MSKVKVEAITTIQPMATITLEQLMTANNMKKELIEKIIRRLSYDSVTPHDTVRIKQILSEELPDFQRIDEERFLRIYRRNYTINIDDAIKEYNSTLPPALKPLPKEMPEWFAPHMTRAELWDQVVSYYGTPEPKPSLPTVEELGKEIASVRVDLIDEHKLSHKIAKKLHDKYSLHPHEWWQDCEKFMYKGRALKKYSHEVFPDGRTFLYSELSRHELIYCTPYTTPTAQEIIAKHNLSEEEVRAIREGKCT